MKVARWLFTMEGSSATPRLSAAVAAVGAGVFAGIFLSFRITEGWGVVGGLGCAVGSFLALYPKLRQEHDRQQASDPASITPMSFRDRLESARPGLIRLAVLFGALPVGFALSIAIGSAWGFFIALLSALIAVTVMRRTDGRGR